MSTTFRSGEIRLHQGAPLPDHIGQVEVLDGSTVAEVIVTYCGTVVAAEHVGHRGLDAFSIGEAHDVTFAAPPDGLPERACFNLVQRHDHGHVLRFAHHMAGDVLVDGTTIALAELVRTGRAQRLGDVCSFAMPPGARCRVHHGDLTFHVRSVAPGARIAQGRDSDRPFWVYNALSAAVIGSVVTMLHLVPEDSMMLAMDEGLVDNRFVGYMAQPDDLDEPEPGVTASIAEEPAGGTGQRHAGDEGELGDPRQKQAKGIFAIRGPKDADTQLARNFDPANRARYEGILGIMRTDTGHFLSSLYGPAFAVGNDDEDVWGGFVGTEIGTAHGLGGMGLVGSGRGGGGPAHGMVGLGHVGSIGKGGGGGPGLRYGRGKGTGFPGKARMKPRVHIGTVKTGPSIDKDVVRRVVRAHINEVRGCYNQGLTRQPNLRGRVAIQFTIGPAGTVPFAVVAESSVKDPHVGRCIAKAVKRWRFPKPRTAGSAIVTYPFVLNPA